LQSDSGHIDFAQVFKRNSAASTETNGKKLHIELGSGSGDWACLQAKLNPSDNYVTVELRSDRVAQTFAKCLLHQQQNGNQPLTNLCCVGSECGSFLRDRVQPGSVTTIFVNHPEPPTQTYSINGGKFGGEEPAHMLNSQTIRFAARCLEPAGKGRLVIVTDNLIYARLICQTLVHTLNEGTKFVGLSPDEVRDLRRIESFGQQIHLFEGKPSSSIGHYIPKSFEDRGTSYFDRLWRSGAGKHADMKKRYIIGFSTTGGTGSSGSKGEKSNEASSAPNGNDQHGKKAGKKKSEEKQRRRNERRLLKKQQELANQS